LERTDLHDERPHPGRSGTRAALELLEPMEPYVSDNVLNGEAVKQLERFERLERTDPYVYKEGTLV
jgi:hypothetical protein